MKCRSLTGFLLLFCLWQGAASLGLGHPVYFASPLEVAREAARILLRKDLYLDCAATLRRAFFAVTLAGISAIPCGLLFGCQKNFFDRFAGSIDLIRSIPPVVLYPLLLVIYGPDDKARVIVSAIGAGIVILLITARGVLDQSQFRRKYFQLLGASSPQVFFHVICFEALPSITVALRTAASLALIFIVVTEMVVGAEHGLGTRVMNVQITSNIPDFYFTCIVIGALGVCVNGLLLKAECWMHKTLLSGG